MALSSRALSRALVLALIVAVVACALLMGAGSARAGEPGQTLAPVAQSGDPGVISGRVTKGDGAPFDDACTITAYGYYYGFSYQASVREDGTYAIGPVAPDYYQVRFDPVAPWEGEWWSDCHGDRWSAWWVYMGTGDPVSDIDARLERLATVSGTVTDADGAPVAGAGVAAYQDEGEWVHVADATTDEAGRYSLLGLHAGVTKVRFAGTGALAGEWWNDKDTLRDADAFDVPERFDVTGIDARLTTASSVEGLVTDKAGNALEGLSVAAWQQEDTGWRVVSDASTDATGHYSITGLHRGATRIHFYGRSFVGEWYVDQVSKSSADDVPIPAGSTVDGIDAALARPSSVSGSVTTEVGQPAAARVAAYQEQGGRWLSVGDVSTDALGNFRVDGLRTGDVRLRVTGPDIVGEWWHDKTSFSSADGIPVAEETDVSGIDAVVQSYGRISGRVTDSTGSPVWAWVGLYRWTGMWWQWAGSTNAGWDGRYSFSHLAPGEYTTYYYSYGYLEECYDDAWPLEQATRIPVASGQHVTGIDAALSVGSTLSGVVKGAGGTPVQGVTVRAYRYEAWWDYWDEAQPVRTGPDGSYSIGMLRDGAYQVEFVGKGDFFGEWYDNARTRGFAEDVLVPTDGEAAGIDAVLETGGRVTGTVVARNHTPLAGIRVSAYQQDGRGAWHLTGRGVTDEAGSYAVAGLAEGMCRVGFSDPAQVYLGGYWRDAQTFDRAAPVSVRWGETTSGIDGTLVRSSHITGVVRRADGSGVSGAHVAAYADDGDGGWTYLARVTADPVGSYDVPGLPAGQYRVRFSDLSKVLAPEWWNDAPDVASARSIQLDRQQVRTGVDAVLQPAGAISGTVSETGGDALRNVAVVAYARDAAGGWTYVDRVSTDARGHYSIGGVGTGKYRLKAVDKWPYPWSGADRGEYLDEWYRDAYSLTAATDVPVAAGAETAGVDIGLGRPGSIAGRVTDASGAGVRRVAVEVRRFDGRHWKYVDYAQTAADGAYHVGGLPGGQYRVEFIGPWRSGYADQWYDGVYEAGSAKLVTVAAGQTTTGIDAVLQKTSRLEGRVTGSSGEPLSGVWVYVGRYGDGGWEYSRDSSTDATGAWSVKDQRPGTVRVRFDDVGGRWATEFWDDQVAPADGAPIQVTAGQLISGLDAQLSPAGGISGTAMLPDGRPADHADVILWARGPNGWHQVTPGDPGFVNHFGQFSFKRLHEGTYRISVDGRRLGYAPRFWPSSPDLAGAGDIVVQPGQDVGDIDLLLGSGEAIAGHVTVAGGRGAEVSVTAYRADGADWEIVADTSSDATGAYTLRDLAPGTYRLSFGDDAAFVSWFFTRWARGAASLEAANDIRVRAGAGTVVVDETLVHRAQPVDISSSTQPDLNGWYRTRDAAFAWSMADPAVADGYGWLLDRAEGTVVPKTVTGSRASASYKGLADGTWYFHVRGLGVQEGYRGVLKSSWSPTVSRTIHIDTVAPTTSAPASQTATRGSNTSLVYRVNDAAPNGGTATVRIEIRDARNRLATTLDLGVQNVNRLLTARFRCQLAAGSYTFSVLATDTAGNPQSSIGSNKLKVK